MFRTSAVVCFIAACLLGLTRWADALVIPHGKGHWPADWPQVLEPLRKTARSVDIATGIQEERHWIPVADRETFDRIWPAVLSLRSPNGTLTLTSVNAQNTDGWFPQDVPAIRITAPVAGSYSVSPTIQLEPGDQVDYSKLINAGLALRIGAPWPESVTDPDGVLPEYVRSEKDHDGRLKWVPANASEGSRHSPPRGFLYRARVDLELTIDGSIIDLNHVKLPESVQVIDQRTTQSP